MNPLKKILVATTIGLNKLKLLSFIILMLPHEIKLIGVILQQRNRCFM